MPGVADYQDLEAALEAVDAQVRTAEAHGLLCGMAGAVAPDKAAWIAQVLADCQPRGEPARVLLAALVELYSHTLDGLDDPELSFQPLLPAEDEPLGQRARALGEWCGGFLAGVGLAGQGAALPPEANEALRDLSAISRVETDAAEDEDNEAAYAELVEFVRVAAMLVRSSLRAPEPPAPGDGKKPH